jgi:hypothetical protein
MIVSGIRHPFPPDWSAKSKPKQTHPLHGIKIRLVPLRFVHKSAGLSDGVLRVVVQEQDISLAVTNALQRAEPSARTCLRRTAQRKAIVAKGDDFGRRTRHSGGHF